MIPYNFSNPGVIFIGKNLASKWDDWSVVMSRYVSASFLSR